MAAIVNWYGITDVLDLIKGDNVQRYALRWLGVRPDRESLAKRVSPLTYVRADLPPILTVHGEKRSAGALLAGASVAPGLDRSRAFPIAW